MRRLLCVLVMSLNVAACAPSLAELRDHPPTRSASFRGTYDAAALCVLDALDRQTGFGNGLARTTTRHVDRRSEQQATLTAKAAPYVVEGPLLFEMTFRQATPETVILDYRAAATPLGLDHGLDDKLWPLVERCGGRP